MAKFGKLGFDYNVLVKESKERIKHFLNMSLTCNFLPFFIQILGLNTGNDLNHLEQNVLSKVATVMNFCLF